MEFDFFSSLDGASPWWWIALAIAVGAVEMLTFTYFLIWIALAAFAVGLAMVAFPLGGQEQIVAFALLSILFTVAGRFALKKVRQTPSETPGLNRRSEKLIGRKGKALADFENDEGLVVIDDVRWCARLAIGSARKGESLVVIDAEGMQLICEPG